MLGALLGGAAIGAAGNLISSGLNAGMTAYQNKKQREFDANQAQLERNFNANQAALNRDFNANQAQVSRDWQERMSNTSYQRAVKDLEAAGLNPALAYSQGGASSPSGSSASGSAASAGSGARSHEFSYAQSAKMVADGFGAVGNALTAYGTAMSARQEALDLVKSMKGLDPQVYGTLRALMRHV